MLTFLTILILILILFSTYLFFYLNLVGTALYISVLGLLAVIIFTLVWLIEAYHVIILNNAPYVRSSKELIEALIKRIDFKDGDVVYELGCGDALFLRKLIKKRKIKGVGYEYFIFPYLLARLLSLFSRGEIKIYFQDFLNANLSEADYIFCYLLTSQMERLENKLKKELKAGAIIISNGFKFKNWQPQKVITLSTKRYKRLNRVIYLYKKEK